MLKKYGQLAEKEDLDDGDDGDEDLDIDIDNDDVVDTKSGRKNRSVSSSSPSKKGMDVRSFEHQNASLMIPEFNPKAMLPPTMMDHGNDYDDGGDGNHDGDNNNGTSNSNSNSNINGHENANADADGDNARAKGEFGEDYEEDCQGEMDVKDADKEKDPTNGHSGGGNSRRRPSTRRSVRSRPNRNTSTSSAASSSRSHSRSGRRARRSISIKSTDSGGSGNHVDGDDATETTEGNNKSSRPRRGSTKRNTLMSTDGSTHQRSSSRSRRSARASTSRNASSHRRRSLSRRRRRGGNRARNNDEADAALDTEEADVKSAVEDAKVDGNDHDTNDAEAPPPSPSPRSNTNGTRPSPGNSKSPHKNMRRRSQNARSSNVVTWRRQSRSSATDKVALRKLPVEQSDHVNKETLAMATKRLQEGKHHVKGMVKSGGRVRQRRMQGRPTRSTSTPSTMENSSHRRMRASKTGTSRRSSTTAPEVQYQWRREA